MKKAVKAIYNGGCGKRFELQTLLFNIIWIELANNGNKIILSESLEKLGINSSNLREKEEFIGAAFVKFSFIVKELAALEKTLVCDSYLQLSDYSTMLIF